uniref:Amidase domain-containing protein n=3 Tax=Rhodnius TaxID=13248 RepID=T1HYP4_RHOPR
MSPYKLLSRIINQIARIIFKFLGYFAAVTTIFAPLAERKFTPTPSNELLKISAKQLSEKIRRREVRCVDVVGAYIDCIKELNPLINSVVQDRFEDAVKEAELVDRLVQDYEDLDRLAWEKPLLGVPLTVKETVAVKDMSNNSARSRVSSHVADQDAECVALLREAGAIPLAVTNTPELCLYLETYNPVHGRTNNPYDTRRTPAGSSGGEAALLGAGASLTSVGSDIAGSLRLPAMFCGVFSHKPTPGFISNQGHIPTSKDPLWDYYFTIGPLARYAEDLPLMLRTMIPSRNHPETLRLDEQVNLKNVKVFYMYGEGKESVLQDEPNFQLKKALKTAVDILNNKYGCFTSKVDLKCFRNSLAFARLILQVKGVENVFQKDDEHPDDYGILRMLEIFFKKITFQTNASISTLLYGPLQCLVQLAPKKMKENLEKHVEYTKNKVVELLGEDGVLIYPSFSCEAQYHYKMCGQMANISYCLIFNALGLPVTQCHIGYNREGLPVGVQVVAAPKMDRISLAVAQALSAVTGGWHPPEVA